MMLEVVPIKPRKDVMARNYRLIYSLRGVYGLITYNHTYDYTQNQ